MPEPLSPSLEVAPRQDHDPPDLAHQDHAHADQDHDQAHQDNHDHGHGWWGRLKHAVAPHSHDAADSVDEALESSERGIRAVKISLVGLGVTAALQVVVVTVSGSVALLADTIHNFSDALTAVPLWIAFLLGRRAATRRYTYGFGRAEDLAGLFVLAMIALSAVVAGWEAVHRLLNPAPVSNLGWVAVAGLVGFAGNEAVALFRIHEGKAIGSAALVADGHHARTDGLTSLAVVAGAGGVALGWNWADPLVGLFITVAILVVLRSAGREVFRRLMDGVDPALVAEAQTAIGGTPGVRSVQSLRMRWIGHELHAEGVVVVEPHLSVLEASVVTRLAEQGLVQAVPKVRRVAVHAGPGGSVETVQHAASPNSGSFTTSTVG